MALAWGGKTDEQEWSCSLKAKGAVLVCNLGASKLRLGVMLFQSNERSLLYEERQLAGASFMCNCTVQGCQKLFSQDAPYVKLFHLH